MMFKLFVSELAHQDLDSIVAHIALQLCNPSAAQNFLDEVEKCYEHLKSNPFMYAKCRDKHLEVEGYRKAIINNYILIFKVDETSSTVNGLRVFYGARDYGKLL